MELGKWLLITLFILAQINVISNQMCPAEWKGFGNSCYLFVTPNLYIRKSSWSKARKHCIKNGADLVSLTTNQEVNFVYSHTKSFANNFWIGLRYANTSNSYWAWSNGEKLDIKKWSKGEPNNIRQEHCTEILRKTKFWNNLACYVRHAWICEKPKAIKRIATEVPVPITTRRSAQDSRNKTKVISIEKCSGNWKRYGNSCYLFVTPNLVRTSSWSKARNHCIKNEADLVSLTTNEEVNFVYSHTKNFGYAFWIGLRYTNTTNPTWAWSNGEKLNNFTKWNNGEPNNIPKEHCVEILRKFKFWNNKACYTPLPWICEKPKPAKHQGQLTTDPVAMTTRRNTQKNMNKETNSSSMSISMALYIFLPMILLALIIVIILLIRKNKIAAQKKYSGDENDRRDTVNQDNYDQNITESGEYAELDENREPDNTYTSLVPYENPNDYSGPENHSNYVTTPQTPRPSSYVIPPPSHEYEMPDSR